MTNCVVPQSLALFEVLLRKRRCLPCAGEVLVRLGDLVRPDDVVAKACRPAEPVVVMVGPALGVATKDVTRRLRRWAGEALQQGEILAEKKGILGVGKRVCRSPVSGVVVSGPHSCGEVVIARPDEQLELRAGLAGRVVGIVPSRGVVVEMAATYVRGVGGYGGEARGTLQVVVEAADDEIDADKISEQSAGMVLAGGHIGLKTLVKAVRMGVVGLIVGGISGEGYRWLLDNRPALAVVITSGGGAVPMAAETYLLLERRAGMQVFVDGSPEESAAELIVPLPGPPKGAELAPTPFGVGSLVRMAGGRWVQRSGRITALPPLPRRLPSGVTTLVAEVQLAEGESVVVARTNLLLIG